MKIKKRFAFTMAEIMVVLAVIGLVLIATYQVSKIHMDKATQYLYYGAFQQLKTIGAEIYVESSDKMLPKTDTNLCNSIAKLVNTVGTVDCTLGAESEFTNANTSMIWSNGMKYFNFRPKVEDCRTSTKAELYITNAQDFIDCIPQDGTGTSGKTYKLTSDVDFAGVTYSVRENFAGTLDGDFYRIKNLTLNNTSVENQGLFGKTASGAILKKMILQNFNIKGKTYVGALVGYANYSKIDAVGVDGGKIEAVDGVDAHSGGVCGFAYKSQISNSYSTASIFSTKYSGGVVGHLFSSSSIKDSYATGDIVATAVASNTSAYAGGFAGRGQSNCSILTSYATGNVSATHIATVNADASACSGGFIGHINSVTILNSYATGNVYAKGRGYIDAGGFVGEMNANTSISSSYSTGNVQISTTQSTYLDGGGFVGTSFSSILNSYSIGNVSMDFTTDRPTWDIAGFGGANADSFSNCFWDIETSGFSKGVPSPYPDPAGLIGKTSVQMKTPSTFASAGWSSSVWSLINGYYPTLKTTPGIWDATIWDISKYPAENPTFKIKREEVDTDIYSIAIDINGGTGKSEYDRDVFKFDIIRELGLIVPALGSIASESGRFLSVSIRYEDFSSGNRAVKWLEKNIGYRQAVCMVGTVPSSHEYCQGKGSFTSVDGTTLSPAYTRHATCTPQANCEIVINKP